MYSPYAPETIADNIRPLLPLASKAYGGCAPESPERAASDTVNHYILMYADKGGSIPLLGHYLQGDISTSGLRRRLRSIRAQDKASMEGKEMTLGGTGKKKERSKEPKLVEKHATLIKDAKKESSRAYGDAVRHAYDSGVSLSAIAKELDMQYHALWTARRSSW